MERLGSPLRDVVKHESVRPIAHEESDCDAGTSVKTRRSGTAEGLSAVEDMMRLSELDASNIVIWPMQWLSNPLNFESIAEVTLWPWSAALVVIARSEATRQSQ